jgi:hypothetical protein
VSNTISRIAGVIGCGRAAGKLNLPRFGQRRAGIDHVVGLGALFGIGHLQREHVLEAFGRHAGPGKDPCALHFGRGRNHGDGIDLIGAALLEQQRDVEHDQRRASMLAQEGLPRGSHGRMDDRFEPGERGGIIEHRRTELLAADAVRAGGAWERGLDRFDQLSAGTLQAAHDRIGIEHRHAQFGEHRRDGRLAHPDRTGEPEDERSAHAVSSARSSASCSRGAGSPKNFSKATAAWPISIESPSTVRKPAARAAWSSGVSAGCVTMS